VPGPRRAIAAEAVRLGVERGEIRSDVDVAAAADQLFAPVYYRLIFGHDPLTESFAERLVDQLMTGLRPVAQDVGQ
jgi:hypothetical protein